MMPRLPVTCPWCASVNDDMIETTARHVQPREGQVGICCHCLRLFIFTTSAARRPTSDELTALLTDEHVLTALKRLHQVGSPHLAAWINRHTRR